MPSKDHFCLLSPQQVHISFASISSAFSLHDGYTGKVEKAVVVEIACPIWADGVVVVVMPREKRRRQRKIAIVFSSFFSRIIFECGLAGY